MCTCGRYDRCAGDDLVHAKAIEPTRVCVLRRSVYMEVMEYSRQQQITTNLRLLSSIPLFANLSGECYQPSGILIRSNDAGSNLTPSVRKPIARSGCSAGETSTCRRLRRREVLARRSARSAGAKPCAQSVGRRPEDLPSWRPAGHRDRTNMPPPLAQQAQSVPRKHLHISIAL